MAWRIQRKHGLADVREVAETRLRCTVPNSSAPHTIAPDCAAALERMHHDELISAWAAISFAPTLIGRIYGMNFANMPVLGWVWGIPSRWG